VGGGGDVEGGGEQGCGLEGEPFVVVEEGVVEVSAKPSSLALFGGADGPFDDPPSSFGVAGAVTDARFVFEGDALNQQRGGGGRFHLKK
jgi:hypothetical protein